MIPESESMQFLDPFRWAKEMGMFRIVDLGVCEVSIHVMAV